MRKSGFLFAFFFLAACSGSDIADPAITASVLVTSSPTQITVGETAQASAIVRDQNGNPLAGKTVVWTSLNQSVATVTAAGVIRGVAQGSATIQGTVDGITGTAAVQVVAITAACANGPTSITLAVGQVRVVSAAETQGCIGFPSSAAASQYIVIAANTNPIPDALASFAIRSDTGEVVPSGTLLTDPFRGLSSLGSVQPEEGTSLQSVYESGLRLTERRELDIRKAQRAYAEGDAGRTPRYSAAAAIPVIGEKTRFRIPKSCTDFTTVTATVRHISARAIIYTDSAAPANGFADADLQVIAREFDDLIYPTDVDYFGTPLDLDENSRVVILYTPEVNKLTPSGNPTGFVGGFFFAGDLLPGPDCPQSNRAEIFYVLAPDPTGTINGNSRTVAAVRQGTRGTIAHELQHMINASERIRHPITDRLEAIWLDEALSHFAEDLNGRVLRGLTETGDYTIDQLTNNGTQVNDFNAFFFQNFARLLQYLRNPGPNSPTSAETESSLADRGAAWALLRYTADHYAPGGNVKAFVKALVPGPDTGVVNLRGRAGGVAFDALISNWMVANYTDGLAIPNLPTTYSYKTYNIRNNVSRVNTQGLTYPLFLTEIQGPSQSATGFLARSGSGHYFRLTRTGAGARTFRFVNNDLSTAATFTGATLVILRTQ